MTYTDTTTNKRQRMRPRVQIDVADVMVFVGLGLLAGGLGAYDWRLALIVCGLILLVIGLIGAWRS